ncbi:MAG: caspase family protein, partial [Parvularculaceae bacterium]
MARTVLTPTLTGIALAGLSAVVTAGAALGAPAGKIDNFMARPLAASEGAFLRSALQAPAAGSCDVLSPDPNYREEMLVRFGAGNAKTYERRVALVVGNGAYRKIGTLKNPPKDAASMAKMFRGLGFTVYRAIDVTEASFDACFSRFRNDLEQGEAAGTKTDVSLFFYAGHGVQLTSVEDNEKRNYMLSVDAAVDANGKAKGFKQIDAVLNEMREHSGQALFLYDACRNAPYAEGAVKEAGGAAVRMFDVEGAAPISASPSASATRAGLFIAYATAPGTTADDAWGPQGSDHSPFTQALLNNLATPGIAIDEAMVRARSDVGKLTADADGRSRQTPWTSSSKTETVWLNGELNAGAIEGRVRDAAFRSEAEAQRGSRFAAAVAALKGLPKLWPESEAAAPFASAKAALARAYRTPDQALIGHQWDVLSAEFAPDGKTVVTASFDNQVRFWDAATGRDQGAIRVGEPTRLVAVRAAFSPDGRRIAVGVPGAVRLYDATSRALLAELSSPAAASADPDAPLDLAFSPDGSRIVAVMDFGRVEVF